MDNVDSDIPDCNNAHDKGSDGNDANFDWAGAFMESDEIKLQFRDFLLLRPRNRSISPHIEKPGHQPVTEFVEDDPGQEECVIEDGGCLEVLGQQPANLKDMLM